MVAAAVVVVPLATQHVWLVVPLQALVVAAAAAAAAVLHLQVCVSCENASLVIEAKKSLRPTHHSFENALACAARPRTHTRNAFR
jgi:hypothetical protein